MLPRPGLELFEKFINVSELFKYMHNVPTDYKTYASPYMWKNFSLLYFLFCCWLFKLSSFELKVLWLWSVLFYYLTTTTITTITTILTKLICIHTIVFILSELYTHGKSKSLQWHKTNHGRVCRRTEYKLIFTKLCLYVVQNVMEVLSQY